MILGVEITEQVQARKKIEEYAISQKNSFITIQSQKERFGRLAAASGIGVWYCNLPFVDLIWDEKVKEHFWLPTDAHVTIDIF